MSDARPASRVLGRRRAGIGLPVLSGFIAVVLALPLLFLVREALGIGLGPVLGLIARPLTLALLANTLRLSLAVTALCVVLGTAAAFAIERTDLRLRPLWAALVVLPLALPDFVIAFAWSSLSTWVEGFRGAVLVMTLGAYPLVYLPVAAALRHGDPDLEDISRSLGMGRLDTFVRVTLGQVRGAVVGGALLVCLVCLAEYGAFEILGYQTFTTEIFAEFSLAFSVPTACALSLVLVALSLAALVAEQAGQGASTRGRGAAASHRPVSRIRLGAAAWPVTAALALLIALALGVPVGAALYWLMEGGPVAFTGVPLLTATAYTAAYSGAAALLATAMALPLALYAVRRRGPLSRLTERSTYLVLGLPGLVVALALAYFMERYAGGLFYQSSPLLVVAYAILFFPLALTAVRASVERVPLALEEVARSLGRGRLSVFARIVLPLAGPGLAASFCLVFLSAVTELTATLILVPTGVQTLATQFWAYEQNLSYGQAAPFALAIIALAVVPTLVLGRYFDRLPAREAIGA